MIYIDKDDHACNQDRNMAIYTWFRVKLSCKLQ